MDIHEYPWSMDTHGDLCKNQLIQRMNLAEKSNQNNIPKSKPKVVPHRKVRWGYPMGRAKK